MSLHSDAVREYEKIIRKEHNIPSSKKISSKRGIDFVVPGENGDEYYIIKATAEEKGAFTAVSTNVQLKIQNVPTHFIIARKMKDDKFSFDEELTPEQFARCQTDFYGSMKFDIDKDDIKKAKKSTENVTDKLLSFAKAVAGATNKQKC